MTSSHPHATVTGMDASYNENSQIQRQGFEHFWPWLEDAVTHSSNMGQSQLISYVDFGCSGGRNSATHFCKLKSLLEKAGFLDGVSATSDIVDQLVLVLMHDVSRHNESRKLSLSFFTLIPVEVLVLDNHLLRRTDGFQINRST